MISSVLEMNNLKPLTMKRVAALLFIITLSVTSFANSNPEGVDPTKKIFKKWMNKSISYPSTEVLEKEEGLVEVSFEIGVDGQMENIAVESSLSETFEEKAVEMVKAMPKQHLYENGFTEGTRFVLPVKFQIN